MVFNGFSVLSAPCLLALLILSFCRQARLFRLNNRGVFHKHGIRRGDGVFRRVRKSFCFGVRQTGGERVYKRLFRACHAAVFCGCRFIRLCRFRRKVAYEKEPAFMEAVFRGARQGKEKRKIKGADYLLSHAKLMYKYFISQKIRLCPTISQCCRKGIIRIIPRRRISGFRYFPTCRQAFLKSPTTKRQKQGEKHAGRGVVAGKIQGAFVQLVRREHEKPA